MSFFAEMPGRTGEMLIGPIGACLPMPYSGDGCTIWIGGKLIVFGARPGMKAQLIDQNNIIIAEAIVDLASGLQFFRPPFADFPVGRVPNVRIVLNEFVPNAKIWFPSKQLSAKQFSTAVPLFINSQNWHPSQYDKNSKREFNNMLFEKDNQYFLQCSQYASKQKLASILHKSML